MTSPKVSAALMRAAQALARSLEHVGYVGMPVFPVVFEKKLIALAGFDYSADCIIEHNAGAARPWRLTPMACIPGTKAFPPRNYRTVEEVRAAVIRVHVRVDELVERDNIVFEDRRSLPRPPPRQRGDPLTTEEFEDRLFDELRLSSWNAYCTLSDFFAKPKTVEPTEFTGPRYLRLLGKKGKRLLAFEDATDSFLTAVTAPRRRIKWSRREPTLNDAGAAYRKVVGW